MSSDIGGRVEDIFNLFIVLILIAFLDPVVWSFIATQPYHTPYSGIIELGLGLVEFGDIVGIILSIIDKIKG